MLVTHLWIIFILFGKVIRKRGLIKKNLVSKEKKMWTTRKVKSGTDDKTIESV